MSRPFQIVAHRGIAGAAPENTLPAFQQALDSGADAVHLDVRLTRDGVPAVYHYVYLEAATTGAGPIFTHSFEQIRAFEIRGTGPAAAVPCRMPTLADVLELFAGQIGLEIEVKGPEPESATAVSALLGRFRRFWDTVEVTSYEPALLLAVGRACPGLACDLLFPRSESWMESDTAAYLALQRARLAGARAVHLHPAQLAPDVVAAIRAGGVDVHAWDVNDEAALTVAAELGIPRVCTDRFEQAYAFRAQYAARRAGLAARLQDGSWTT